MSVTVRRILLGDPHEDAKWVVLEACVDGAPAACVVRRSINTAALVSGAETVAQHRAELEATAQEYFDRYQAVQAALGELEG